MPANTVSIYQAKTHLSHLIAEVEKTGRPITICRGRKPVADLVRRRPVGDPLKQDPKLRGAKYLADPCAPLPAEAWPEECR